MVGELHLAPPYEQTKTRICGCCPRELSGGQQKWCSDYCRQWATKNPGQRQKSARPINAPIRRQKFYSGPGLCKAGCGNATMPSKSRKTPLSWCSDSCRQWAKSHPGQRRDQAGLSASEFQAMNEAFEKINGGSMALRERLGRRVRDSWLAWAMEQPNPKPNWLLPYDQLSTEQKDVDCRIGLALYRLGQREAGEDVQAPSS